MKTLKKNNKGFSLVELIVVILIMAIIAVALAPQVMKWVDESKVSTDVNNRANLKSSLDAAVADFFSQKGNIASTIHFDVDGKPANWDRGAWRATAHVVTEADVTEGTSRETCQPFPFWLSGFDVSLALRPQPTIVTCSLRPPLGLCSLSMPVRSIWGLFWWQFVFPQWQPLVLAGWFSYF